ncbi:JmjC domain-containing protein [Streptomyces sp. NPDC017673]
MERELRTRLQANLYASWTGTEGFGVHWDDHDTITVQLNGAKW